MTRTNEGPLLERQNQVTRNFCKNNVEDHERGVSTNGPIPLKEVTRLADLEISADELFDAPRISKSEILLTEKLNRYADKSEYRQKKDTGQKLPIERFGGD